MLVLSVTMGCGISTHEDPPIVALCRSRRNLIRRAADVRYVMTSAHAAYFRSLTGVGDALHRFAQDELASSAASPPPSPVLTIPSSEGKCFAGSGGGDSSSLSPSISPVGSHLHFSSDSHLHFSSDSDDVGETEREDLSASASPNYHYMTSSTAIPHIVYEDPYSVPIESPANLQDYYNNYYYGNGINTGDADAEPIQLPPPPPPPTQGSVWDFFNPFFDSDDHYPPSAGYYTGKYGVGSDSSSSNLSEVRKREGIPELEDETEQEPIKASGVGSSNTKKGDIFVTEEIESQRSSLGGVDSKSSSVEIVSKSSSMDSKVRSNGDEEVSSKKKRVSFDGEASMAMEGSVNSLSAQGTRDFLEAVGEIKEQFKEAASCGEEVSRILEVGKLRYRSRWRRFRVLYFRILDLMDLSHSDPSNPSLKHPQIPDARVKSDLEKHIGIKSSNLSTTLEMLYMWENKLYKEVKVDKNVEICSKLSPKAVSNHSREQNSQSRRYNRFSKKFRRKIHKGTGDGTLKMALLFPQLDRHPKILRRNPKRMADEMDPSRTGRYARWTSAFLPDPLRSPGCFHNIQ